MYREPESKSKSSCVAVVLLLLYRNPSLRIDGPGDLGAGSRTSVPRTSRSEGGGIQIVVSAEDGPKMLKRERTTNGMGSGKTSFRKEMGG